MSVSKIDWTFWLAMPEIKAWQAVALSLDIDPDQMRLSRTAWMRGPGPGLSFEPGTFQNDQLKEEFGKRVRLLTASLSDRSLFKVRTRSLENPAHHGVQLREVAAWLSSLGRAPMADGFLRAAESADGKSSEDDERIISDLVDAHVENDNAIDLTPEVLNDSYDDCSPGEPTDPSAPISRHRWQESEILRTLQLLGYKNALSLPKNEPGKKGVRHEVRSRCAADNSAKWSGSVFDKAWNRLSEQARIKYCE